MRVASSLMCLLSIAVCWQSPTLLAQEPEVRAEVSTKLPAYVGQRINFYVELLSPTFFEGTAAFELPEVSDLLIMKVEDRPTISSETIDGHQYSVQRHEFAAFAQRAGSFQITPIQVRFSIKGEPGQDATEVTESTERMTLEAELPAGAEDISMLLTTNDLTVTQQWKPTPQNAKVGDAFTRTITFRANDLPAMVFPPLPNTASPELGVYVQQPTIADSMQRGTFTGQRVDSIVYVCEQAGTATIPTIVVPWFDLASKEMKRIELEGAKFEVAAIEPVEQETDEVKNSTTVKRPWWPWFIAAGLVAFVIATRRPLAARWEQHRIQRQHSEAGCFDRLLRGCRTNDSRATLNSLYEWIGHLSPGSQVSTAEILASRVESDTLMRQIDQLQSSVAESSSWNGSELADELRRARRQILRESQDADVDRVGPLNP